jgi:23S rRNA (uracil1939-C5)-methyltransferase
MGPAGGIIGVEVTGPASEPESAEIVDTLVDGRGVARTDGKTIFVRGAIKGERVRFVRRKKKKSYDEAELTDVLQAVPERVQPQCASFDICGGCSLQHLDPAYQLELKQSVLIENLQRIGSVRPATVLEPVTGNVWGYRRKARLAVKYVTRKGRVLVGFRERNKPFVADMKRCETLHPSIGDRIPDLIELIDGLSIRDRLPQIEAAVGDNATGMIFRVLGDPTPGDRDKFADFQQATGVQVYLQRNGPSSITALSADSPPDDLYYELPKYNVKINFSPTDFMQVHADVNGKMIDQAISLLNPDSQSRVLDLYCGLGNFSLPVATIAGEVTGIEFSEDMVERAAMNARQSTIGNAHFHHADLSKPDEIESFDWRKFDLVILDPPRTGALEMMDILKDIDAKRVVYISCHPGTMARDADRLVHELGYDLTAAGVMDMFPHTSHVESMALFSKSIRTRAR